jgi:ribosomal protein RSM22 (predicted rRNA methylase)
MQVDAVDADRDALDVARAVWRGRPREDGVVVDLRTFVAPVQRSAAPEGRYDLVLLGQVLSEMGRAGDPLRAQAHADLLASFADTIEGDGAVVVIEPALRANTRHLHAVRDLLCDTSALGARLRPFAPCLHDGPCPALGDPTAWCHEDMDVDLPGWLIPIARAAGLRWQGLTFSYLVLRTDGKGLVPLEASWPSPLRVVSEPIVSKGKREAFLCGIFDGAGPGRRCKAMRLDRHGVAGNAAWDDAARGDVLCFSPPLDAARPRIGADTIVKRVGRDG